jgi:hypothetical protein
MKIIFSFLFIFFLIIGKNYAQFVIPGEGIMDVKIGADWDEVEWELGFKGTKVNKNAADPELKFMAEKAGVDFDFIVMYQHLMWLPVSEVFFKDDKVCMIQLNSYPEYNKMLCADIGTVEGLNFWDNPERVKEIYNNPVNAKNGENSYILFKDKGLGVQIFENEVRTMFIFQPQMK